MAKPEVDEDWGQASIFINLANRRYLKTDEKIPLSPPQSRRTACWPLFCFCSVAGACSQENATKTKQVTDFSHLSALWRRERDSNPRSLAAQRFSRPPQSTTLPSLQAQKYALFFNLQNFLHFFLHFFLAVFTTDNKSKR